MIRIFEHIDENDNQFTVETFNDVEASVWATTHSMDNSFRTAISLPADKVSELRAALRPHDLGADGELAEEFRKGYEVASANRPEPDYDALYAEFEAGYLKGRLSAIDDYDYVSRDEHVTAVKEARDAGFNDAVTGSLDLERVAALTAAVEMAKKVRSTNVFGSGSVDHETVLAYAQFLLDQPALAEAK